MPPSIVHRPTVQPKPSTLSAMSPSVVWIVLEVSRTASPEPNSLTKSPLLVMHLVRHRGRYRVRYRVCGRVRVRLRGRGRGRIRSASMAHLAFSFRSFTVALVASASRSMYGSTWCQG